MAGYSSTPLAKKLGIKSGSRLLLLNAPPSFAASIEGLPDDVTITTRAGKPSGVVLLFCRDEKALTAGFPAALTSLEQHGGLWLAWPKKSSGVVTDLTESIVQRFGLEQGLVDNKVCAIDETWGSLRFVVRLADRT